MPKMGRLYTTLALMAFYHYIGYSNILNKLDMFIRLDHFLIELDSLNFLVEASVINPLCTLLN